ncbi:mannan-binding protein [Picosynechococcus sp. PCC 7117]|uniref:mannan-binding protein n=1 Tax=Picosynechococcus sp. PCC 7117 TaxID=195498 RepID=UPI000903DCA2|nr:mannan-binding protein [Picosynechococcus sp. PCC 7117]
MFNKLALFSCFTTSTISLLFSLSLPATANTTRAVEAGPIWNQSDANIKCPRLAQEEGGTWTGHWWTTISGVMSVCQLEFSNNLESKSFSILNYNVMLLSRNIPGQGNLMQNYRAQEIATAIRNSNPWDVIVINEAFDNEARNNLSRSLKEAGYSSATEVVDTNNGKLEDGGVYLQSRWPIMATDQIIFSDCSGFDCQSNKGAVYAKINKEGIIYHIFGTHLQADTENSGVRANQLRQLETFINQKTGGAQARREAIIIAGDLNFNYQTAEYDNALETLNAQFLGNIPQGYTFDPRMNDLAKYRYPNDPSEWLDYVLVSNESIQPNRTTLDLTKFRTTSQYELPGKGDFLNLFGGTMVRDLSDHYGLSAIYLF